MRQRSQSSRQQPSRPSPNADIRPVLDAGHRDRPAICGVIDAVATAARDRAAAQAWGGTASPGMSKSAASQPWQALPGALRADGRPAVAKAP